MWIESNSILSDKLISLVKKIRHKQTSNDDSKNHFFILNWVIVNTSVQVIPFEVFSLTKSSSQKARAKTSKNYT
jgi:hypothetical protein